MRIGRRGVLAGLIGLPVAGASRSVVAEGASTDSVAVGPEDLGSVGSRSIGSVVAGRILIKDGDRVVLTLDLERGAIIVDC